MTCIIYIYFSSSHSMAGNPIARLVSRLCLDKNKVMLRLEDTDHSDEPSDLIHSSVPAAVCNSGDEDEGAVKKIRRRKRQVNLKKEQTGNLQSETGEQKHIIVEVDLSLSAFANARNMYSQMKVAQQKEARTREATAGALRAVEDQAARTLRKMDLKTSLVQSRKVRENIDDPKLSIKLRFCVSTDILV